MANGSATVLISVNTFWNIVNFRAGLIDALVRKKYAPLIATPDADPIWAKDKGVGSIAIDIDRSGLNPFNDARLFFKYLSIFREYRPQFFLGYTAKPNIYGSIAARICGVNSIPNVSGLGTSFINPGPLSTLVGALYRVAFAVCPIVFFQNEDDRDLFIQRKIVSREQARLLPGSGVDLDHFSPMPAERSARRRFLFSGRLLGDKGVREFVEAARLLRAQHPDWKFQLLGLVDEGNRSGITRHEIEGWVKEGVVDFLGETDDVRPYIARATAVVLPSYREGMPKTLLEAAAMARPMIASDVPGNRQIVEHGTNGLLCAARDPHLLASAMRRVGEMSQVELAAMGQAGRAKVERDFGEDRVIQAYLEALAHLSRNRED